MTDHTPPACSWRLYHQPHGPHDWQPHDGDTVHCDGYQAAEPNGPSVREAAANDRRYWDVEKGGE